MSHRTLWGRPVPGGRAGRDPPRLSLQAKSSCQPEGGMLFHFTSAHQGTCLPQVVTSSFQKGPIKAGSDLGLGLSAALSARPLPQQSGVGAPLTPFVPWWRGAQLPYWEQLCLSPQPLPPRQLGTPAFTEGTFHSQVQINCSPAHQGLICSQHLSNCVLVNTGMLISECGRCVQRGKGIPGEIL